MINIKNLVKSFGGFKAVDNISFEVPKGQVLGFLGPNGAGKSTTMRMITGFIEPTSGTIKIKGINIAEDPISARKLIGYLPENSPSYGEMTVYEFLDFIAQMRYLNNKSKQEALTRVQKLCMLENVWFQPIETLSRGYRQRVGVAQAIIHDPDILILDEPTDGLDPNQKHHVRQLIKNMGKDKTIILSTHILEEVEIMCERVIIIAKGKLVADDTPDNLKKQSKHYNAVILDLNPDSDPQSLSYIFKELNFVDNTEIQITSKKILKIYPKNKKFIADEVSKIIHDKQIKVNEILVDQGHLDEVFRTLTIGG